MSNIIDSIKLSGTVYTLSAQTSGTVSTAITSGDTNAVAGGAVYDKFDEVEQVTAQALNVLNDRVTEDEEVTAAALVNLNEELSDKQDTLIAGENITISGNVISATGGGGGGEVSSAITSGDTNAVAGGAVYDAVVYSANTYNTELTFDAYGYAENWIVGQSAITIDVSGYTATTKANYQFENSNGEELGNADIYKMISPWWTSWDNKATNCTITTDGDTATTATITNIPSGTVKIRRTGETNPPKAIISGDTPETWIKDALDNHRDNTTVHITAAERSTWNNKSNFSGSYNDLTDKPIPDSALTSYSTNAVQSKTLYSELRIAGEGEQEVTLEFEGNYSTNYIEGCTKIKVENISSSSMNTIAFYENSGRLAGNITISNWGSISVNTSYFQGATYEISGSTVIISYPSVTTVYRLRIDDNTKYTYKAITSSTTPLKNQVVANTTALGGKVSTSDFNTYSAATDSRLAEDEEVTAAALNNLNDKFDGLRLLRLTQAEYDALSGSTDSNTLYVIVN